MFRRKMFSVVMSLLLLCSVISQSGRVPILAHSPAPQAAITNKDLVLNGAFNLDKTAWSITGLGSGVNTTAGQDGGPALVLDNITGDPANNSAIALQELHLPSQTTTATYAFDYNLVQTYGTAGAFEAGFMRGNDVQSATVITVVVATGWVYATTGWQSVSGTLTAADIATLQAAHADGEHVWFVVNLLQADSNQFQAHLDNVTFNVTGSLDYPNEPAIAYIGADSSGYDKTVNTIQVDGTGKQSVWTHPSSVPTTNHIYDVAWKPNGVEIAFSSNHESAYSAFNADVYGIKPDGTGLRRITNAPSKAEIDAGGYPTGTVTGSIQNDYGNVTTLLVYVEGASEPVSVDIGDYGTTTGFSVANVADMGVGSHYVVLIWSSGSCANGREYTAAVVDVVPGGTVDTGALAFTGNCGTYNSTAITWQRDGTEVGVDVITPRKFTASGQAIGNSLFTAPLTADKPAWSPVNDQILYRNWIIGGDTGLYLTTVDGATGTWLVNTNGALWVTPAWLPDGSGFVYTIDNQIRQHILSGNLDTLLATFYNEYVDNPSVSPDGTYIVFERQSTLAPIQYNLWIIKRSSPTEMWAVTADGKSYNPDWSRVAPPEMRYVYLPLVLKNY